jgi:arginine-tRNA-protein transferase
MAELHLHLPAESEPCAYLPGLLATTEYRFMTDVTAAEMEHLLERGWRRFGAAYFRPVCTQCLECVSLRIPVSEFSPTKSQRRAWRKCANLRVATRAPVADAERLELYRAWHAMREQTRGWQANDLNLEQYHRAYCIPHPCARELDYYDGNRLVAVGLVDETPRAVSSVYFYYHPDIAHLSLGVASVLFEVEWARQRGRQNVYLGYRIAGCPSTAYKSQFGPHELLTERPDIGEPAVWRKVD